MDLIHKSASSQAEKQLVYTCQKYCNAQPRLLAERTFYRHLAEAQDNKHIKIIALKAVTTLNATHAVLAHRQSIPSQDRLPAQPEPGPSTKLSQSTRQAETQ